jgi:NodT family efflux transporter outer membrane factor (OMF) lipoprotein
MGHLFKKQLIFALPLLLAGCGSVGPEFLKPEVPIQDEWLESKDKAITTDEADLTQWWQVFNDPVLDSLITAAHKQNLSLQIAGIRILESRAQLGIAVGDQYPQFQQARAGISRVNVSDNQPNFSSAQDSAFWDANVGLDVGWELDMWGKFKRGIEAADADLLASIADYDDVMVSLTGSVATAYIVTRTFEERLAIARQNVETQKRSLNITEVRFRNGATTELDVQQARTLLYSTQALIPDLEIGLRQSKNALSILLGMPPNNLDELMGEASVIPTAPSEIAIGIPAELLRRRPDIRRAELLAAAQSARIGLAESDLYPHFSLVGSIGFRSSDTFDSHVGDLLQSSSIETFAGPSLTWDILNYDRIKNNVRVQDARLQQLIVNYQNTVLEASREVEDAMVSYLRSQERVIFLRDSEVAAQRSVDIALIQYRDGVTNYQRVVDTEQKLLTAQDRLTDTRGSIASNLVAIYRSLGGGWKVVQGNDVVPASTRKEMADRTDWGDLMNEPEPPVPAVQK